MTAAGPWIEAMRDGDFRRALACNDAVLAARQEARATPDDPALPYHRRWVWDGTPPDGRTVLVRCYHGLGDTLQFARYLPALRARARRVVLEAPGPLVALLRGFVPALLDGVTAFRDDAPLPPSECDVEIMELGHVLRLPPPLPLAPPVPAARVAAARHRIAGPGIAGPGKAGAGRAGVGPAVGLCWQAGEWDAARSVPFEALQPLLAVPGLRFVSLQRGPAGRQADARFLNPTDLSTDVTETAALLLALDLVVSVDTMVAHLAGALGVPALVVLHAEADWRWARGDRTAWYPRSTLLRQGSEGEWGPVIEAAGAALRQLAWVPRA